MRVVTRFPIRLALLVLAATVSAPAFAFRCHSQLVKDGDPQTRVLQLCGEPASRHSHVVYRSGIPAPYRNLGSRLRTQPYTSDELLFADRSVVEVVVEEWIYNFGPHRLMQRVRFEDGLVTDVDYLDYGYSED
jgi:hypothetical protein